MNRIRIVKKGLIVILGLIILSSCTPKNNMDIYLCIGQSNMAGRGPMDASVSDTLEHVFLFTDNPDQIWEKAANPLNKYSSIRKRLEMQQVSPAYSFAKEMAAAHPQNRIGLVVNAKGGTSINMWHPDSLFFQEAVRRTKLAMQYGELKGIIWHQGCSDARKWKSYRQKLEYMVSEFRREFGDEHIPFIAGQLSPDKIHRKPFNEMLLTVPNHIKHSAAVSSEGLSTIDSTHFDTKSQVILGRRYATEMLKLIDK